MAAKKAEAGPASPPAPAFEMDKPYLVVQMKNGDVFHLDAGEHKILEIGPPGFRVPAGSVSKIELVEA